MHVYRQIDRRTVDRKYRHGAGDVPREIGRGILACLTHSSADDVAFFIPLIDAT